MTVFADVGSMVDQSRRWLRRPGFHRNLLCVSGSPSTSHHGSTTSAAPITISPRTFMIFRASVIPSASRVLVTDSYQLVEPRLGLDQIGRIEAFGEPAVDRALLRS